MPNTSYVRNPFGDWTKFDPSRVQGHTQLLQSIVASVTDHRPQAVNLVGPRWIGKTTLLRFISDPAGALSRTEYQSAIDSDFSKSQLLPVYVDMKADFDPENPFIGLANRLYASMENRPGIDLHNIARRIFLGKTDLTRDETEQRVLGLSEEASRQGIRLIVCLDHLDKTNLLSDGEAARQIYRLTETASVIIASRTILRDLSALVGSPLAYILVIKRIGLLDEEASNWLLSPQLPADAPEFAPNERQLLIEYVGRHPYLLLRAADQAYEHLLSSRGSARLTTSYLWVETAPILEFAFEHLWRMSEAELRAFFRLQERKGAELTTNPEVRRVIEHLLWEALIYENPEVGGQYLLFSPLFQAFVSRQIGQESASVELPNHRGSESRQVLAALGIDIGTKEGQLLHLLVSRAGNVVPEDEILKTIWRDSQNEHALHTTVARLRSKFRQSQGTILGRIVRHRKKGFSFEFE